MATIRVTCLACCLCMTAAAQGDEKAPVQYLKADAYHVLPGTHNNESGYFSLCEGLNRRIYIGTTRYGENSHLVEFDPKTGRQRMVIDTHKLCGLTDTGYAAQAKIHSRNDVGASGKIYCGSYQGYRQDKSDTSEYKGGYVMTYDPKTDTAEQLGMPCPGEGVGDVVADEANDRLYIVTSLDWRWIVYDMKTRKYRPLNVTLTPLARTMIDVRGRANAFTDNFRLARYDPATDTVTIRPVVYNGKDIRATVQKAYWTHVSDGKIAYMVTIDDKRRRANLWAIDLLSDGPTVRAELCTILVEGDNLDCNCGLDLGPDGRLYAVVRAENKGEELQHLLRYDPDTKQLERLGAVALRDPGYVERASTRPDGGRTPHHGFFKRPDGAVVPRHHLAMIVTDDGTIYLTYLYPFTLARIEAIP